MLWSPDDFETTDEMNRAFYAFYEERGYARAPATAHSARDGLQQIVWDPEMGNKGSEWQTAPTSRTQFDLGTDSYQEMFIIENFRSEEEAEEFRIRTVAELQQALSHTTPGSAEWWRLQGKIKSLGQTMRRHQLLPRRDNENADPPYVDDRKPRGVLQDVRVGGGLDPNVETRQRFAPAIKAMQKADILPGRNGEYETGSIWGPKGGTNMTPKLDDDDNCLDDTAATELPDSDRKVVETNHAFLPRHHRPRRIGLGYHGYDEVFRQQRDGVRYTSSDLMKTSWRQGRDTPMCFASEDDTEAHLVENRLKSGNPVLEKHSAALKDDLKTIVENHEHESKQREQKRSAATATRGPNRPRLWGPSWE